MFVPKDIYMHSKRITILFLVLFAGNLTAQTLSSNQVGKQGGYTYEFWKQNDQGTSSMVLGDSGNFQVTWNNIFNVVFRKGLRPGSKDVIINYSATYNPNGNSYLTVYGWTTNPLVEYYIVESWGSWRPPGGTSKGVVTIDGVKYDLYQTTRTNQPSIEGMKTFPQFWSVRQTKNTSGTVNCASHFNMWASKQMNIGTMYEVSFAVEGYQSSGNADVRMSMISPSSIHNNLGGASSKMNILNTNGTGGQGRIDVIGGGKQTITFMTPKNSYISFKVYNFLGKEIAELAGKEYSAGTHSVTLNTSNLAKGVYYYTLKNR
jgi:endo-1,4-beta-xylanase